HPVDLIGDVAVARVPQSGGGSVVVDDERRGDPCRCGDVLERHVVEAVPAVEIDRGIAYARGAAGTGVVDVASSVLVGHAHLLGMGSPRPGPPEDWCAHRRTGVSSGDWMRIKAGGMTVDPVVDVAQER